MPTFSRVVPYDAFILKAIILDVEQYPAFLPWVKSARCYNHDPKNGKRNGTLKADLNIGYKNFEAAYTSEITYDEKNIIAKALPNPWVNTLETHWILEPSNDPTETKVVVTINVAMATKILDWTIGQVLNKAAEKFIDAFCERADALKKTIPQ